MAPTTLWQYSESVTINEYITPYSIGRTPDYVVVDGGREEQFYKALSWCPHCEREANQLTTGDEAHLTEGDDPCLNRYYTDRLYECPTCGWWSSTSSESTGSDSVDSWIEWRTVTYAILRAFEVSARDIPVDLLARTLIKRQGLLYAMHDKKFEELVAAILRDFYPGCEVSICGRRGDLGIDLVVIRSDSPIAVQVRRRLDPRNTETVYPIREFLGASLLQGYRELIYVTTSSFSRASVSAAKAAVGKQLVQRYDLIDADRLMGMLDLASVAKLASRQ
jgi:restriction system protein